MENYHDPVRQLKYLRQTLSQNNKPLGFFISAGCPLAVEMPSGKWPLIPDIAGITKFVSSELTSKDKGRKSTYDILLEEIIKAGKTNPNIEDILSFVRTLKQVAGGATNIRGLTENQLMDLEKSISKKIVEETNVVLPSRNTPYHQLARWIHLIDRGESPIECFTTNYDLLTEQAFEETGVAYFDGFVGSRNPFFDLRAIEDSLIPKHWTRLWKIHGSINWFLNPQKEIYRSTNIEDSDSYVIHPSHLKYDESKKMPYTALIDRLNVFLRQPSVVLITIGYSFSDIHLNDTIMNALRANPTAMVIVLLYGTYSYTDKSKKKIDRYEKAFSYAKDRLNLSAWCFDEAVIGGQQRKWKVSQPDALEDENLGEVIVKSDEVIKSTKPGEKDQVITHYQLQLGNFAKFGNFLQELIGKEQFKVVDAK